MGGGNLPRATLSATTGAGEGEGEREGDGDGESAGAGEGNGEGDVGGASVGGAPSVPLDATGAASGILGWFVCASACETKSQVTH